MMEKEGKARLLRDGFLINWLTLYLMTRSKFVFKKLFYRPAWLLGYIAIALALIALSVAVFLDKDFPVDTELLLAIHRLQSPLLDRLMLAVTYLGNPEVMVPAVVITFGLLWRYSGRVYAWIFGLNCLGGAVLSTGFKLFFAKSRPHLWQSPIHETTFSYPSGHALGAVVLYGFLAHVLAMTYPRLKGLIYGGAIALCLAIGFSRLYLGVHWPTDILAGYMTGFLWISLCLARLHQSIEACAASAQQSDR